MHMHALDRTTAHDASHRFMAWVMEVLPQEQVSTCKGFTLNSLLNPKANTSSWTSCVAADISLYMITQTALPVLHYGFEYVHLFFFTGTDVQSPAAGIATA